MNSRKQSFTLMELMIVVVIIGVIAGFAVPSYQHAVDKAKERRAALNLFTIQQAMNIRYAKTGEYMTENNWLDINTINTKLGLKIYGGPSMCVKHLNCRIMRMRCISIPKQSYTASLLRHLVPLVATATTPL